MRLIRELRAFLLVWLQSKQLKKSRVEQVACGESTTATVVVDYDNIRITARENGVFLNFVGVWEFLTQIHQIKPEDVGVFLSLSPQSVHVLRLLNFLKKETNFWVDTTEIWFNPETKKLSGDVDDKLARWTYHKLIQEKPDWLILMSSDGDFLDLIKDAQRLGVKVCVLTWQENLAIEVLEIVDDYLYIDNYLNEITMRPRGRPA